MTIELIYFTDLTFLERYQAEHFQVRDKSNIWRLIINLNYLYIYTLSPRKVLVLFFVKHKGI